MAVLEDEETQKIGLVTVASLLGPNAIIADYGLLRKLISIKGVLPDRCGCNHFCTDSAIALPFLKVFTMLVPKYGRARLRHHYGST